MKNECQKYRTEFARRLWRQQAFHAGKEPGDLLVVYKKWERFANLDVKLCARLYEEPTAPIQDRKFVSDLVADYLRDLRDRYGQLYELKDDLLPTAVYYTGIGSITAAQTGLEPMRSENTSWLEPNLDWERIEQLRFDPDNRWLQLGLLVNNELWRRWEEDFFVLPYLHRSPLDAANGIRGTMLFEEMYTHPEKVKVLIDHCANWSLQVEDLYDNNVERPQDWGNGVWGVWLPERAVFVNGDPVGLISCDMMPQFEQPFTEKLFTQTGGGFFHNHTLGLYQVDQVAQTKGTLVQEFVTDPKTPTVVEALLQGGHLCESIISASLEAPVMIEDVYPDQLDRLLPIIKQGRFIVELTNGDEVNIDSQLITAVEKLKAASNIS